MSATTLLPRTTTGQVDVHKALQTLCQSINELDTAYQAISCDVGGLSSDSVDINVRNIVEQFFTNLVAVECRRANINAHNPTHFRLTPGLLSNLYNDPRFVRDTIAYNQRTLSDTEINSLARDFGIDNLYMEIEDLSGEIETKGYMDAAENLASFLSLRDYHQRPVTLLKQSGRVGLSVSWYGYSSERQSKLNSLLTISQTLEHETGATGMHSVITQMLELESQHGVSLNAIVPSRTTFVTEENIKVVFYQGKFKAYFPKEIFLSYIAFMREYAPFPIAQLT